jgi:hypothetical protein
VLLDKDEFVLEMLDVEFRFEANVDDFIEAAEDLVEAADDDFETALAEAELVAFD